MQGCRFFFFSVTASVFSGNSENRISEEPELMRLLGAGARQFPVAGRTHGSGSQQYEPGNKIGTHDRDPRGDASELPTSVICFQSQRFEEASCLVTSPTPPRRLI